MVGLLQGMAIGFTAGIVPGPLLALFLSHAARHGWRQTMPAVFAPLVSDGPIILLVVVILSQVPDWLIAVLRIIGGVYLVFLAVQTIRPRVEAEEVSAGPGHEAGLFRTAVAVNLLNPNPYIFWGVALGPALVSEWRTDPISAVAFVVGFYTIMIGIFAAWVVLFGKAAALPPAVQRFIPIAASVVLAGYGFYQIGIALSQTGI